MSKAEQSQKTILENPGQALFVFFRINTIYTTIMMVTYLQRKKGKDAKIGDAKKTKTDLLPTKRRRRKLASQRWTSKAVPLAYDKGLVKRTLAVVSKPGISGQGKTSCFGTLIWGISIPLQARRGG